MTFGLSWLIITYRWYKRLCYLHGSASVSRNDNKVQCVIIYLKGQRNIVSAVGGEYYIYNKSNHSAGSCELKQICQGHPFVTAQFFIAHAYLARRCLILKIKVKMMEHQICNDAIRWQISKSIKYIIHFCSCFQNFQNFQGISILNFLFWHWKFRSSLCSIIFAMITFNDEYQPLSKCQHVFLH